MKTDNIFDLMKTDLISLEENISEENMNYDTENIERLVRNKIEPNTAVKSPKANKRKLMFALFAAALIIASFCTTATAMGLFDNIFKGYVIPKSEGIAVTAPEINVNSDDLDITLNGITGDDETIYAAFTITKKDKSRFIDNENGINDISFDDRMNKLIVNTTASNEGQVHKSEQSSIRYSFEDEWTIMAFLEIHKESADIDKISFKDSDISVRRFKRIIYQAQLKEMPDGSLFYSVKENQELLDKYSREYEEQLKENEIIEFDSERCALCIFEIDVLNVSYEVSFDADYSSQRIDLLNTAVTIDGYSDYIINDITASSCSISIFGNKPRQVSYPLFKENCITVELSDGKSINAQLEGFKTSEKTDSGKNTEQSFEAVFLYSERNNDHGISFTPVDPKEITSITIEGQTIKLNN